jgi:hypothetical protein
MRTAPINPRRASRAVKRGIETEDDVKSIRNYQSDLDRYLPNVEKAYHIVIGSFGSVRLAGVRVIMTESKKSEIENDMEDLPC